MTGTSLQAIDYVPHADTPDWALQFQKHMVDANTQFQKHMVGKIDDFRKNP
jgi:hypothetical protein